MSLYDKVAPMHCKDDEGFYLEDVKKFIKDLKDEIGEILTPMGFGSVENIINERAGEKLL